MVNKYSSNQKLAIFLGYLAGYFGLQILLLSIYVFSAGDFTGNIVIEDLIEPQIYISLISAIVTFIALIFISRKQIFRDLVAFKSDRRKFKYVIGGVVIMYLSNVVLTLLYSVFGVTGSSENQVVLEEMISGNPLAMLLPVALLIPIIEEILFRGVILEFFEKRIGIWGGAAVSSLFFGLLHVSDFDSLIFLPVYWLLGMILATLYIKTNKNLIFPILAHVINNTFAVLVVIIANGGL